jgi:glycosyltransferase involved in cell wall biosynthesis
MSKNTVPLISFLIPSYNHARYIGECVESILRQEGSFDFEVIVADDCSTDDTLEVLKGVRDTRVRVLPGEQNAGQVATMNRAVAAARGQFLARQDSDNRYRPYFLEATLEIFRAHPNVGMVYGEMAGMDSEGKIVNPLWSVGRLGRAHNGMPYMGNDFLSLLVETPILLVAALARRELWMEAFPLPDWLPRLFIADDWVTLTRMLKHQDAYYLPRVLTDYRLHEGNLHRQLTGDMEQEAAIRRTLDEIFADPERAEEKRRLRGRSYATMYSLMAPRYLVAGKMEEARRCYLQMYRLDPRRLTDTRAARGFARAVLGARRYETWKARLGRTGGAARA